MYSVSHFSILHMHICCTFRYVSMDTHNQVYLLTLIHKAAIIHTFILTMAHMITCIWKGIARSDKPIETYPVPLSSIWSILASFIQKLLCPQPPKGLPPSFFSSLAYAYSISHLLFSLPSLFSYFFCYLFNFGHLECISLLILYVLQKLWIQKLYI